MVELRLRWRKTLRALHRDIGYLAVGLTVVYALSGIAVNHIADWEPNFRHVQGELTIDLRTEETPAALAERALSAAALGECPVSGLYADSELIQFECEKTRFEINLRDGRVFWERDEPRFFLRAANWLHLNRGKAAWTYVADLYAVGLLFLALSGLFMIPGRRGILGRGLLLALLGAAVPIIYVCAAEETESYE